MTAGVEQTTGSVVAFTDDDAVPRPDWTRRLLEHFEDTTVGAVGGRDVVHGDPDQRRLSDVGIVTRWGKVIGNHHLASGGPRDVSALKGANMAFRREALAIPVGLRGDGAEVHNDLAMSLWAARQGWRVVFDPAVVVDHYVSPRFDSDQRGAAPPKAVRDASYNLVLAVGGLRPELYWRRAVYGLLVGDAGALGAHARRVRARARRSRDGVPPRSVDQGPGGRARCARP